MRARFVNEIKQDKEISGLGSIGIGKIATTKGYNEIKKLMGSNAYQLMDMTDISIIKYIDESKIMPHICNELQSTKDHLIFFKADDKRIPQEVKWGFLDYEVFREWRSRNNKQSYNRFLCNMETVYYPDDVREFTTQATCVTSYEWQIVGLRVKMIFKQRGYSNDTYYIVKYK